MLMPAWIIEPRRFWRLISTAWSGVIARMISVQLTLQGLRWSMLLPMASSTTWPECSTVLWSRWYRAKEPKARSTTIWPRRTLLALRAMSVTRCTAMPGDTSSQRQASPGIGRNPWETVPM